MNGFVQQLRISLVLHARNRMALIYGYLFPTIFLVAFRVLYRFEQVPLTRHLGELLTITVLGGACFGLPTTLVSERERGVWRRYRLAPIGTGTLVAGTVLARYVLLLVAGLLQLALAMAIGMPMPNHPLELLVAFTCVAFALIGLGLVIATMADTVPAVQALGQCVFLPMLIIGGVAVPLVSLPEWAQRASSFFPGRYSVEAMQACVTGNGLPAARFSLLALLLIGGAGCLAGAKLFRWDAQQRFSSVRGKGWVAVALAAWAVVGVAAETRHRGAADPQIAAAPRSDPAPAPSVAPVPVPAPPPVPVAAAPETTNAPNPIVTGKPSPPAPKAGPPSAAAATSVKGVTPTSWRSVTMTDIERDLIFTRLPPDEGVVTPIAGAGDEAEQQSYAQLEQIRAALPEWKPGKVADPVQRVRNFLYVAAVPDVFQMQDLERFVPLVVYDRLQEDIAHDDLIKILYWIATHPFDGDDGAVDEMRPLGINNGPADVRTVRERLGVYAVKLLGRLTGRIPNP